MEEWGLLLEAMCRHIPRAAPITTPPLPQHGDDEGRRHCSGSIDADAPFLCFDADDNATDDSQHSISDTVRSLDPSCPAVFASDPLTNSPLCHPFDMQWSEERLLGRGATSIVYEATDRGGGRGKSPTEWAAKCLTVHQQVRCQADAAAILYEVALAVLISQTCWRDSRYLAPRAAGLSYNSQGDLIFVAFVERVRPGGLCLGSYVNKPCPPLGLGMPTDGTGQCAWACAIVANIAKAVEDLHRECGVVHNDLKPQNVVCYPTAAGQEVVALLDFGSARRTGPSRLRGSGRADGDEVHRVLTFCEAQFEASDDPDTDARDRWIGTVWYASPEQCRGPPYRIQSAVWSLGVLLCLLTTGRLPFADGTVAHIIVASYRVWECEEARAGDGDNAVMTRIPMIWPKWPREVRGYGHIEVVAARCWRRAIDERPALSALIGLLHMISEEQRPAVEP